MRAVPTPSATCPRLATICDGRFAARERQADLAVAREIAGAGEHQIAEAGQPGQRQRLAALAIRQPPHLGEAAGDERGARAGAEAEPVAAAGGDGDDVLERAAHADADRVVAGVDAQPLAAQRRLHDAGRGESAEAATSAAGSPAATSCAKLGPDSTTARLSGRAARRTSIIVSPLSGSRPFEAQTTIVPASIVGAARSSVARTSSDGMATTTICRPATVASASPDTATASGRRKPGTERWLTALPPRA